MEEHQSRPGSKLLRILLLIVGMGLFGLLAGLGLGRLITNPDLKVPPIGQLFLMLGLCTLIVLNLHEAGHLLAGLAVGFSPRLFIAGPLTLEWSEGKARARFTREWQLWGGLVAAAPRHHQALERRIGLYVAGGPMTSLILGLLLMVFGVRGSNAGPAADESVLPFFLLCLGLLSTSVGLATLVPSRPNGFLSDGARLLRLLRGGPEAERDAALAALGANLEGGVRPRDLSPELLERSLRLEDKTAERASALIYAYLIALDQGERKAAAEHLERAMALIRSVPPSLRPPYYLEQAYWTGRHGHDPARADEALTLARGGLAIDPISWSRAEAAVSLAVGEYGRAVDLARQALAKIDQSPRKGTLEMERTLLEDLLARANMGHAWGLADLARR